ncbi:MAG: hypothetical protein ACW99E_23130 [Promethearchaeota archaeon]|jgi:hypothetical protein
MEELKDLYKSLEFASEEERKKIWQIILEKNKNLFDNRLQELKKFLNK